MASDIFERSLSWLVPDNFCYLCGREKRGGAHFLCEDCERGMERAGGAIDVEGVDGILAPLSYADKAAEAVKKLKYGGARHMARPLASFIDIPKNWEIEAIVPVPLHRRKQWKRGYNQSALISREIAKRLGVPHYKNALVRVRNTPSQTGFDREGREKNMRGAFKPRDTWLIEGKNVLLVDDVLTTGATAQNCASALKEAGAARVYIACVCAAKQ